MTANRFHVRRRGSAVALAAIVALAASTVGSVQQADAKPRFAEVGLSESNSGTAAWVYAQVCDKATRPGTRFRYTTTVFFRGRAIGRTTRIRRSGPKRCALMRGNVYYNQTAIHPYTRAVVRVVNLTTRKAATKRVPVGTHG